MAAKEIHNPFFIQQLKKGEETAFETLFRLYFERLHHFAFHYIENTEDAKEVVQDTFYKLWKNRKSLSEDTNINAYLFTLVKNKCLDHLKHIKVKQTYRENVVWQERLKINNSSLESHPHMILIEKELYSKVNELIEQLPQGCRQIFIKSRFEGLRHIEIANELEISPKTVENQIAKALKHLRKGLKNYASLFLSFLLLFLMGIK